MEMLQGIGASAGVVFAPLRKFVRKSREIPCQTGCDAAVQRARFEEAVQKALSQLDALRAKAVATLGEEAAEVFAIHAMMLEDLDFTEGVTALLTEGYDAAYAVHQTGASMAAMFAGLEDDYMRARAQDVEDINRRLCTILQDGSEDNLAFGSPCILAADDLLPSETARLDKNNTLALAMSGGAVNSHTAIFARAMGIPAVIGLGKALFAAEDGIPAALDGGEGLLYLAPDDATKSALLQKQQLLAGEKQALEEWRGKPTVTAGGKRVLLCANIGSDADIDAVLENDAEGIGLFRSEFLYLGHTDYPDEKTQYSAYRRVAEAMGEKQVIIRTLDIGADKQAEYFNLPIEENPALGMRAIRFCLARPQVFKTQLRAIYRASAHGNVAIMLPMVIAPGEVTQAKEICEEVKAELKAGGVPFNEKTPLGIMIETPAAALLSDKLAPMVDFFSFGTNDLCQYTLALDRQNPSLAQHADGAMEAVLTLMELATQNAHAAGIWCGVCGEMAADESYLARFIGMGIDELSVAPSSVLPLRKAVAQLP